LETKNDKNEPEKRDLLISLYYRVLEKIKPLAEITSEDAQKVAEKVFSTEVTELAADRFIEKIKVQESETIEGIKSDFSKGREDIEKIWGKGFDLMWLFVDIANEISIMYKEDITSSIAEDNRSLFAALFLLNKRGCEVASEIITLLTNGYTDGAYARWRTLWEITIISKFIAEYGNDIAKRYLDYRFIDDYKTTRKFEDNHEKLGLAPMSKAKEDEYKRKRNQLINAYGKNYVKDYGWAWPVISRSKAFRKGNKGSRIAFADIEPKVNFSHWRPYFSLASHRVHASSKSVSSRTDPRHIVQVTAISLHLLTSSFLTKQTRSFSSKLIIGLVIMEKYKSELFQELDKSALERDKMIIESKD
jgi:Family of unknown function (DUF5677)